MTDKQTGGPAFPRPASEAHNHGMHKPQDGMTLRDYFAAKAMQAILARSTYGIEDEPRDISEVSYDYADAMLKARDGH